VLAVGAKLVGLGLGLLGLVVGLVLMVVLIPLLPFLAVAGVLWLFAKAVLPTPRARVI